jgi:hypothetical protein
MSEAENALKMSVAKQKKDVGDQAFKAGEVVNGMHTTALAFVEILL